ncbi:S8 family serine peptidase [Spongorhabdus nitratireducens]
MPITIKKPLAISALALALAGCKVEVDVDGQNHWVSEPFELVQDFELNRNSKLSFADVINQTEDEFVFKHGVLHRLGNGLFSYVSTTGEDASVDFTVTQGRRNRVVSEGTLNISNMTSDPLYFQQWHLQNNGQSGFAQNQDGMDKYIEWAKSFFGLDDEDIANNPARYSYNPDLRVKGQDMNVVAAHVRGYTGKGVVVAVTDSGLEAAHEDLAPNYRADGSFNFVEEDSNDPTNIYDKRGDHGTSVAGLIAAKAGNGIGGRGVAPDATLLGQNYLKNQTDEAAATIHGMFKGADVDVINKSWGFSVPLQSNGVYHDEKIDGYIDAYPALNLRDGKGALVVKSSGNSFNDADLSQRIFKLGLDLCKKNGASEFGLTCSNAAINSGNNHPYQLVVGANNADGTHTSYSTAGSALWVSAPAGEYGFREPAMVTTDQSGCEIGYSGSINEDFYATNYKGYPYGDIYPLNGTKSDASAKYDQECNYVQTFNGTSSAAPNTSGAIALMLDANPDLTWRDVKRIIAKTSDQIDPENAKVVLPVGDSDYVAHEGWVTNAAGFAFNNLFGFGRINAGKAVAMAERYHKDLGDYSETGWIDTEANVEVPDNNARGVTHTIYVDSRNGAVEEVQIRVTLTSEGLSTLKEQEGPKTASSVGSDTAFELTSPSGTKSIMLTARTGTMASYDWAKDVKEEKYMYKDMMLLSNAFYGEPAEGAWTLRVIDTNGKDFLSANPDVTFVNNKENSKLEAWGIKLFGQNFANKLVGEQ